VTESVSDDRSRADQIKVEPAPLSLKPALRRLLTAYLDEFAALEGVEPRPRDGDGEATYIWFDPYWTDADRTPLAIRVGNALAGFCFLRDTADAWQIAEFYVTPHYRRRGIGGAAVTAIKARCRVSGKHSVLEASTLPSNPPALAFWLSQGFTTVATTTERSINVFRL
jgi:predicted acetyltransferase